MIVPKYDGEVGETSPGDDTAEVDVVWLCTTGEFGLRRGAEEDEDDRPSRAKSRLKLLSRERGGRGEELFRLRAWKLDAK